ncbi:MULTISPECIES: pseudoazurin [unclassified Roseitalea]|uniref:pseudoazurin n=1 Tax=unclassified Roseitalea TaxID=2639107 RepID=UPI00273F5C01|nr:MULTISPECIES: pseudoazurin [unclassified Roseitalea]
MAIMIERRALLIGASALLLTRPALAEATTHEVQMLNVHPDNPRQRMVYDPLIQVVQPGDTVRFVSVNPGHNSESIEGMIPEGAEPWKSRPSQDFEVTLTVPGIYGYKCLPHYATGMVGLIIVEGEGKLDNLEAARSVRQRGRAAQVFDEIWAQAEADGLLTEGEA